MNAAPPLLLAAFATGLAVAVQLAPRLGVGKVAVAIIAGQIVGALALDAWGAFGAPRLGLSALRVPGGAAVVAGALPERLG